MVIFQTTDSYTVSKYRSNLLCRSDLTKSVNRNVFEVLLNLHAFTFTHALSVINLYVLVRLNFLRQMDDGFLGWILNRLSGINNLTITMVYNRFNFIQLSLNLSSAQIQCCSRLVGDSRWWGSLTMVPAANKAKCLSSVNHITKRIHHHHHHQY